MHRYSNKVSHLSLDTHNHHTLAGFIISRRDALEATFLKEDPSQQGRITIDHWADVMADVVGLDMNHDAWTKLAFTLIPPEARSKSSTGEDMVDYSAFLSSSHFQTTLQALGQNTSAVNDSLYEHRRLLEFVFEFFDTTNTGSITPDEFRRGFQLINQKLESRGVPSEKRLGDPNELLSVMDQDHHGSLSIDDFFAHFDSLTSPRRANPAATPRRGAANANQPMSPSRNPLMNLLRHFVCCG